MSLRPERIAAASRLLQDELHEALVLASDSIADDLAERMGMVAWEREDKIGAAQRQLIELREQRFRHRGGAPARVVERRDQPLEALALAWRVLREGRRVHVSTETDGCPGVYRILRDMSELLGPGMLSTSAPGTIHTDPESHEWEEIGVALQGERVALVQADADRELAAYLLARACLRRTGFDPRVVHRVILVGPSERFERNLRRLWMGARMGPVADQHAFAGPVDLARADAFLESEAAWRDRAGVTVACPAARLEHADAPEQLFLAPALLYLRATRDLDLAALASEPPLVGPILAVYRVEGEDAPARAEALLAHFAGGLGRLRFGTRARGLVLGESDRQIHGALLVERLPPGLPDPRP